MTEVTIEGRRGPTGCVVELVEGGVRRPLNPHYDIRSHSPTGLEWGYGGSGPAQLALAILAECTDRETALAYCLDYKWDVVAALPYQAWTLTREQVEAWVARRQQGGDQ